MGLMLAMTSLGLDGEALRRAVGEISDGDWLPFSTVLRLWRCAIDLSRDPLLGISVAERLPFGAVGLLFHSANTSDDLRAALERIVRYSKLIVTGLAVSLSVEDEVARLRLHAHESVRARVPPQLVEGVVTNQLRILRAIIGGIFPVEVRFPHAARAPVEEYERRLSAKMAFGAAAPELVFAIGDLRLPVLAGDRDAQAAIELAAQQKPPPPTTWSERVRETLPAQIEQGTPRISESARRHRVSARSLQRRLAAEGTSFADLVDQTRREIALTGMEKRQLGLVEIAFLAGFSDPSAFFRAFRRWTGRTPAEYRRAL